MVTTATVYVKCMSSLKIFRKFIKTKIADSTPSYY